ncbi:IclR family transcriptional regulator [Agromyces aerolatus]|uniref:IclR family transcriptional regulator n=1 Tax=Agromyces sp. LY-1074 TaxID=3074080 RepID=UPI002863BFFE|nr:MULTISPECIES: helix-turn-helix domain-containing protein [unclassified Agromyces]MDR5699569.1 helix-turn-helix domain-containing protein [Agromyces sp. LY-1074]MDR5705865.1 helix-turn-helix domain-containing protein [Agromyces sp. LY-1358]
MREDDHRTATTAPPSQTLSRGIRMLEVLADAREPLTIDELAGRLGVHRSVAYRLLRTLEHHRLTVRDAAGRIVLGARLAALAAGVAHDLQAEALPELTSAANELGMTCFLAVLDGDEIVTLTSVEPRHAVASVAQRPGSRHAFGLGAPGKAIAASLPESSWPRALDDGHRSEVDTSRVRGFAISHDEVIVGLRSTAVPLSLPNGQPAAIAVVYVGSERTDEQIAERLTSASRAIRSALGG